MDFRHELANLIVQVHNKTHKKLGNQDLLIDKVFNEGVIPTNPVRIHISTVNGVNRQYSINKTAVHAEYFFPPQSVNAYNHLCKIFKIDLNNNHLFENGIYGNGYKRGDSRSIKLTFDQGGDNYQQNRQIIANQCVNSMLILLQTIEPNLPAANIIPINYPA